MVTMLNHVSLVPGVVSRVRTAPGASPRVSGKTSRVLLVLLIAHAACNKEKGQSENKPRYLVSPRANPDRASRAREVPRLPAGSSDDDWRSEGSSPDSGASQPNGSAAGAGDAGEDVDPRAEAQRETIRAFDQALQRMTGKLKSCYERTPGAAGEAKLRLRLHRSGYLISPGVSGVPNAVRSCLQDILKGMRVSGVKTDETITIERSLRISKKPVSR